MTLLNHWDIEQFEASFKDGTIHKSVGVLVSLKHRLNISHLKPAGTLVKIKQRLKMTHRKSAGV